MKILYIAWLWILIFKLIVRRVDSSFYLYQINQTALSKVVSFFVEFLKKVNNKVIMIKKMYKKSINLRDWIWTSIKNDRPKVFRKSNTIFFRMNLTVRNIDPLIFSTVELMTKYK